jgi:hypothetical protein
MKISDETSDGLWDVEVVLSMAGWLVIEKNNKQEREYPAHLDGYPAHLQKLVSTLALDLVNDSAMTWVISYEWKSSCLANKYHHSFFLPCQV